MMAAPPHAPGNTAGHQYGASQGVRADLSVYDVARAAGF
jgi:hypothetical protein